MAATVFIGAGAGFAGDRTDAAGPVAEALAACPGPRFLMFETLAERTLALSQLDRHRDPDRGFNPALDRFVGPVLARCLREKIRIVGNFGAANPRCGCRAHSGNGARAGAARCRELQWWRVTISPGCFRPMNWRHAKPADRSCAARPKSSLPIFISALNRSHGRWIRVRTLS